MISMLVRSVIGSAGYQPAAFIAHRTSSFDPTSPTLIGSPGIPSPVCVTMARPASFF
jgi:hypothetical protein